MYQLPHVVNKIYHFKLELMKKKVRNHSKVVIANHDCVCKYQTIIKYYRALTNLVLYILATSFIEWRYL